MTRRLAPSRICSRSSEHTEGTKPQVGGGRATTPHGVIQMKVRNIVSMAAICLLVSSQAWAGDISERCTAAKNKSVGKLAACLQSAEGKLALRGDTAAYAAAVTKCTSTFTEKFTTAEQRASGK